MTIWVFLGPSLDLRTARAELDAHYRPPAQAGDVYQAACARPRAIAIIDGFFERVPAVWHKEVLWALAEGIHVFGAASMGALRATELAAFGMEGVGEVYRAYASGQLEDDDEVAVAHLGPEANFRSVSEAMVNIRATLAAAERKGVLSRETKLALERTAKALHYSDRSYEALFAQSPAQAGVSPSEQQAFKSFLLSGRVDQKREDALSLLRELRARGDNLTRRKHVEYSFEFTHTWEELVRSTSASGGRIATGGTDEAVLEELKLSGQFPAKRLVGLGRLLAINEANRAGRRVTRDERKRLSEELRRERKLVQTEAFRTWLMANQLATQDLEHFLDDEAKVGWLDDSLSQESSGELLDHLRLTGDYLRLRERAEQKLERLRQRGHDVRSGELSAEVPESELWLWYFGEYLKRSVPENLSRYLRAHGFDDPLAFRRAVTLEYLAR